MVYSIVLLVLFFSLMIGVGIWGMKKTSSLNDFFLGGRSIGPGSRPGYGTTIFQLWPSSASRESWDGSSD